VIKPTNTWVETDADAAHPRVRQHASTLRLAKRIETSETRDQYGLSERVVAVV
jgi:hypothetical protein